MSYPIETVRHSLAHVMAAAIQKLYPGVFFAGGPAIENGFYYDLDMEHKLTEEDFPKIEKEMRELIKSNGLFVRKELNGNEAREIFKSQPYKTEWVNDYDKQGETLSIYTFRDFVDLCKGPHVESSKDLPRDSFKLKSVAGAYWKGDSKNKMLQRIYAVAFSTKEELDQYIKIQEEAEKRDHRRLGREMDLFHFEPEFAPGAVFWHEKGYRIYNRLVEIIRKKQNSVGYKEISTPSILDQKLWETSGHWAKYQKDMFFGETHDDHMFCVKPMSCPGATLVFGNLHPSHKDLPLRLAEFGKVDRFEPKGSLHGLFRVREFTQDDAHIYCTEDQIESELFNLITLLMNNYKTFGFNDVSVMLATRPDSEFRIGSDEIWDKAEGTLKKALEKNKIPYEIAEGDAAFYGPKIDTKVRDSIGRIWQCGTIQVDMNLPGRFDVSYIGEDGGKHHPIMIHRAIFGSLERFMGVLLEHNAGNLPLWLSPEPVVVVPVSDKFNDYANKLVEDLNHAGVYARADLRSETVPYKVRDLSMIKTPIIAVVGEKEIENKTVAIRRLGDDGQQVLKRNEFIELMKESVKIPE